MKQYPIAKDGWPYIGILMIATIITYWFFQWWAIAPLGLCLFVVYFFRNPVRSISDAEGIFVSPADGVVMSVQEQFEDCYLCEDAVMVSIFLNLFNVHVNRSPVEGKVEYLERFPGKYLSANRPEAGDLNVKNCLGLQSQWGKILVIQITGLIARRIVCWSQIGDTLARGERFGLIKFGSCTQIYLPRNVVLNVKPGDRVKGGTTILGRFPQ